MSFDIDGECTAEINRLEAENAKLRDVVEAAIKMAREFETDSMSIDEIEALQYFKETLEKVVKVE